MEHIITIILWLLSYFLSKKAGAKSGTAALIATGVTAGAYYTGATKWAADGATSLISGGAKSTAVPSTTANAGEASGINAGTSALGTVGSVAGTAITTAGSVLSSWGAAGTAGVVATTAAVSDGLDSKWLWIGGAALAFFALRR